MTKPVFKIAFPLILLAVAAALAAVLVATGQPPAARPVRRIVHKVHAPPVSIARNRQVEVVGYGSARPKVQVKVAPEVVGRVVFKSQQFVSGGRITAGDVLFRLDETDYRQGRDEAERQIDLLTARLELLDQERANLEATAKIERRRSELLAERLDKTRRLLAAGAGSEVEVDAIEELALGRRRELQVTLNQIALIGPRRKELVGQVEIQKVRRRQAATALERTAYRSPVTGRVLACEIDVGDRLQVGQMCGEVYATDRMEVPVSILAGDLQWIAPETLCAATGNPQGVRPPSCAKVLWHAGGNSRPVEWDAALVRVEAGLEVRTRTAVLVLEVRNSALDANEPILDVNMFCEVHIGGRRVAEAIYLPREAIQPDGGVYVVDSDDRLQRRQIQIARFTDQTAMILPSETLGAGDRVVLDTLAKPVPGMLVQPLNSRPAAAGSPTP